MPTKEETILKIKERLAQRFSILDTLTKECLNGNSRSLIVSGPAGLGKSYTVEKRLESWDSTGENYSIVKGYVRPTGLFRILYKHRSKNQVIVFDDSDSLFYDDVSLNLLKSVCDTTEKRVVSWLSKARFKDDEDEIIPQTFEFEGSIIFITNLDFDEIVNKGNKLAPHLQALISRSHYIDLSMKTKTDFVVRIQQVIEQGLLKSLSNDERKDVFNFIVQNCDKLREISLRMALKLGSIRKSHSADWLQIAKVTCCKE